MWLAPAFARVQPATRVRLRSAPHFEHRARRAAHGAGRAAIHARAANREVTSMRGSRPASSLPQNQLTAGYKHGSRTRDRRYKTVALPTELACGDPCLPSRGTRTHDRCRVKARQPVVRNRTAAMRTRTKNSLRRRTRARHRIHWGQKAEGPGQRQLTGASWERLAESCRYAALRCIEELTHQSFQIAVMPRTRGDARPIRGDRRLRQRSGGLSGKSV
jgi:hypothetical protein